MTLFLRPRIVTLSRLLGRRAMMSQTATHTAKREGNIGDSFTSLSAADQPPLPDKFRELKVDLIRNHEEQVKQGWSALLRQLREENEIIAQKGSDIIPQVDYATIDQGLEDKKEEIRKRGAVVIRGVIPEDEARGYKDMVEDYVKKNPNTKAFPQDDPQVYELYWSEAQLRARSHPNLLNVQRHLLSTLWHTSSPSSPISLAHPMCYADRLRIRQPGDAKFALGPHMDGGSVERWEKKGYGKGGVYESIFAGNWEKYDPWDASGRVDVVSDLYNGAGACSMLRAWQGWLSMSRAGPGEGTLLVNPLVKLSTTYLLLRPFFRAIDGDSAKEGYLEEANWAFIEPGNLTSDLQGAVPGYGQELNDGYHPHLSLEKTMVHMPKIRPGDYVAWHCDTIHAVDKVHAGTSDSSVLYIPVCPLTEINAAYVARQREAFRSGHPAPDFPGGEGEAKHVDRPTEDALKEWAGQDGRIAMGLERLPLDKGMEERPGVAGVVAKANEILAL